MRIRFIEHLLQLFYPNLCIVCGENLMSAEKFICHHCIAGIPRTNFHLLRDNPVEKRFWGKTNIYRATSFFHFQKGSHYRTLLHELKYKNNPEIGDFLGALAASEMLESDWTTTVDIVIPVPLHPSKLAKRGYNQSDYIARGVARILNAEIKTDLLIRTLENETQTRKSVFQRFENTQGIFEFKANTDLTNKHILIVDDVLTTGSTLEACIRSIPDFPGLKISVFTLAVA